MFGPQGAQGEERCACQETWWKERKRAKVRGKLIGPQATLWIIGHGQPVF
jgi:hypothetical protein